MEELVVASRYVRMVRTSGSWQSFAKLELMLGSPVLLLWGILWCMICGGHLSLAFVEGQDSRIESLTSLKRLRDGICDHGIQKTRPHTVSILEFGAVGDGKTLNTHAFENAIFYLRSFADKGGAQLYVPPGEWLTGSFSLTSHLTLFIDQGGVILGSQVRPIVTSQNTNHCSFQSIFSESAELIAVRSMKMSCNEPLPL